VLSDVMLRDAAVLPVHTENDLADLRLGRQATQGLSAGSTDPLLAAVYTHMQRGVGTCHTTLVVQRVFRAGPL
jgi:hypothetical protein